MSAAVMGGYQAGLAAPALPAPPLKQQLVVSGQALATADERPTLLVTTVDIGEGRAGRIEVCLGDDPVDVARAFCEYHGLPEAIVLPLAQHLEDNLAENAAAGPYAEGEYSASDKQPSEAFESEDAEAAADALYALPPAEQELALAPGPLAAGIARSRSATADTRAFSGVAQPSVHSEPASAHALPSSAESQPTQSAGAPACAAAAAVPAHSVAAGTPAPVAAAAAEAPPSSVAAATPAAAAAAVAMPPLGPDGQPLYKPASPHSGIGMEYYNQAADSNGALTSRPRGPDAPLSYRAEVSSRLPAHSRLYADHFRKQQRLEEERRLRDLEIQLKTAQVHIAPTSNKLASHRTAGAYRNYGERLYVEGRLDAMKKEQIAQRQKEEEERAELEQYSFRPEITKMAQQIKGGEAAGAAAAYQRLYKLGSTAKRKERMAAIKREQAEEEVKECSFRPRINSRSARMVEQRQQILKESGLPSYEQLYNDGIRQRLKLEQLAQQLPEGATFRPQVNHSSVVLKRLMEGREGGSTDVATRLLEQGRKYQQKLEMVQRLQQEEPRDPSTGRPLFKPKTYRSPQYQRNPDGTPIGEYLYNIKAEWDEKAARLRDAQQRRAQESAASSHVNTRSEMLVDRLKRERFRAIFDYLRRGDPSPVLNLVEVVQDEPFMDTIDPEVRADIEYAGRLLAKAIARRQATELQDCATSAPDPAHGAAPYAYSTNGEVESAGFVALMEEVVNRTKGLTRQYLLPMPSSRQKFEEPSFRPAIDPKSQELAARVRPETLPAYEVLYKTAEEIQAKREGMKRAAEAAQLRECSFRPEMVAMPKAKEGRAIKLACELTQSKRSSEVEEVGHAIVAVSQAVTQRQLTSRSGTTGASGGVTTHSDSGGMMHFDALEQQINEALVRLSMSEEQVAAHLKQAAAARPAAAPAGAGGPAAAGAVRQSMDANGYCVDYHALLGTPSPDMLPLDDDGEGPAAVTWTHGPQEVVAHVMEGGGDTGRGSSGGGPAASPGPAVDDLVDLAGLDLHALASAGLPEHDAPEPQPAAQQAAPEQQSARDGSGSSGTAVPAALGGSWPELPQQWQQGQQAAQPLDDELL